MPTGTTVTCPLRVLTGAGTCPPDINGAARFAAPTPRAVDAACREAAAGHDLDATPDAFEDVHSDVRRGAARVRVRRSVAGVVERPCGRTRSPEPENEILEAVGCSRLPLPGENSWCKSCR